VPQRARGPAEGKGRAGVIREVMLFACVFAMSAAAPGADTMFDSRPLLGGGPRAAAPLAAGITIAKLLMLTAAAAGVSAPAATLGTLFVALKVAGAGDGSSLGGLHHPWVRGRDAQQSAPQLGGVQTVSRAASFSSQGCWSGSADRSATRRGPAVRR